MCERKLAIQIGLVLSVSLFAASLTAILLTGYYNRMHFQMLGEICQEIIENQPTAEPVILSVLKESVEKKSAGKKFTEEKFAWEESTKKEFAGKKSTLEKAVGKQENILLLYGYKWTDFLEPVERYGIFFAAAGFFIGGVLFLFTLLFWRRKEIARVHVLTDYLEKVNTGGSGLLLSVGEDDFSKLQDEIYKTVTTLYQTRDAALDAKNNFAENLFNIAHQIKTPITSILLSVQMMKEDPSKKHLEQIERQLSRLTHLEEALLLLSRMDAGTLSLERKEVDVFTILMLAADNLQELFREADISITIPESGAMMIYADLDWTMEAIMNLFKNCMEHTPAGGMVSCSYEQNLLYTQIRIWDTGSGFIKEEIPYLFERFYRGQHANPCGVGIGLALSKAIIERQNGTIYAKNLSEGGACFEIRFYNFCSH